MKPSEQYQKLLSKREKLELQLQELNIKITLKEHELKQTCLELQKFKHKDTLGVMNG